MVIFLDGEFEAAKSTFCTFHQVSPVFFSSHFWRDVERKVPWVGTEITRRRITGLEVNTLWNPGLRH